MPQLDPSSSHIARAPITVKPAGLICTAELYLVSNAIKVASSGEVPFTSIGGAQSVSFPITMPGVEGTYKVYIDVFSAGGLIGAFVAREDVVISVPAPAEFEYSNVSCPKYYSPEESRPGVRWIDLRCTITNIGDTPDTRIITFCLWPDWASKPITCYYDYEVFSLTLGPGESFYYSSRDRGVYAPIGKDGGGYTWLHDNKGGESAKCRV